MYLANLLPISSLRMTVTLYALIGFESSTIPADDAKSTHTISKATILGTLFAGFLYILCTFTLMGILPLNELKQSASPISVNSTSNRTIIYLSFYRPAVPKFAVERIAR